MRKSVVSILVLFFTLSVQAQLRKIPSEVTAAFTGQYPAARDVEYKDLLAFIQVHFQLDSSKFIARYNPNGLWKETEKLSSFETLAPEVREGFRKSKYASGWSIRETSVIFTPGTEQYRIKVERNNLKKKYLFFDKSGRLLRDSLTI